MSARAADLAVWHVSVAADGTARRAPQSLGGRFSATPAVMQGADGTLEVFARGFDQQLWLCTRHPVAADGWGEWTSLGGDFLAFPC